MDTVHGGGYRLQDCSDKDIYDSLDDLINKTPECEGYQVRFRNHHDNI